MSRAAGRERSRYGTSGLAGFLGKQFMVMLALGAIVAVLDVALYLAIAIYEGDQYAQGSPTEILQAIVDGIDGTDGVPVEEDGTPEISQEAQEMLESYGAWAMVLDDDGNSVCEYEVPQEVPRSYSVADMGVIGRLGTVADYPVFLWDDSEDGVGMIMVGFPPGTWAVVNYQYPAHALASIPSYIVLVLLVDLLVFYLYSVLSRRRTARSVGPISDALESLSSGHPVHVEIGGELAEVGDQINRTSDIIQRKDHARTMWIRGVSHDIRTPLSMILGYSDTIANDENAGEDVREEASRIRAQAFKIKDLVLDLNVASQLAFDMQPLNVEAVQLSRLLREIVAEHINSDQGEEFPIELEVEGQAEPLTVMGDARLLRRAVENLISNSRAHNSGGCSIHVHLMSAPRQTVGLAGDGMAAVICIGDDGAGVSAARLAELDARIDSARHDPDIATETDGHGLGLVLVARIAWAHGGDIGIDGFEGGGFSTRLALPI